MPRKARPAVLLAAVLVTVGWLPVRGDEAVRPRPAGAVTFADDFTGPAGTPPDPARWSHERGERGAGNGELEYYTADVRNAALDGAGNLVITALREPNGRRCHYGPCAYTSARLSTRTTFTQTYGRFEARIRVPGGQGSWPAFWLRGAEVGPGGWPDGGEIDVMEQIGREPATVHGSLHGPGYSGPRALTGAVTLDAPLSAGFHDYAVDWTPDELRWSVDGREYLRITRADLGGRPWQFDRPFFLRLNLAVGGRWPGPPDATTPFPMRMLVDRVRVTAYDGPPPSRRG